MKKIILLCLTCILALSSAAVCFAEEGADPVETVKVTIQIEGVDETVLYEEVEVQLGEEDIYLSDLLEQLDEKYDDLEIVIENNMVVSVNGVEELDEDLGDVEEFVYECFDDDDCDCCCDDDDCDCCDDDCIEVTCPACEEAVCIGLDEIDEAGEVECPCCGAVLEFEIEEEEEIEE